MAAMIRERAELAATRISCCRRGTQRAIEPARGS